MHKVFLQIPPGTENLLATTLAVSTDKSSYFVLNWIFHYLQDVFEAQKSSVTSGQKVIIVDDLIATGGKSKRSKEGTPL